MKRDSKLSLALHALGHIAGSGDAVLRSEDLARIGPTHPVVIRRVLGALRQAGIVASAKGHHGGWRLARPAAAISVADVYAALGDPLLAQPRTGPDNPPHCAIERALQGRMATALARAEQALMAELAAISIADIAAAMQPPA